MKSLVITSMSIIIIPAVFCLWLVWHIKVLHDVTGDDIRFNVRYLLFVKDKTRPRKTGRPSVIFVHHSVGENLCNQGTETIPEARTLFAQKNIDFYSHNYNHFHSKMPLEFPDGTYHTGYNIPWDSTDPEGLAYLFSQRLHLKNPDGIFGNAFSRLLAYHDVIIVKSCYTGSDIHDDKQLKAYKNYYLQIKEVCKKHPDKIFIFLTPPPRNNRAAPQFSEYNARAVKFSKWMKSGAFNNDADNIFVWDLGGLLRETNPSSPDFNGLKREYQESENDSHPNEKANIYLRPLFVNFVADAIEKFKNRR